MRLNYSIFIKLLILQYLSVLSKDFDFFYFVLQGHTVTQSIVCSYPVTGKPTTDFTVHGLCPEYNDGSYPSNCDPITYSSKQLRDKRMDLMTNLQKDWPALSCPSSNGFRQGRFREKYGTCSESELDQHDYFEAALKLIKEERIEPNDGFYSLDNIVEAKKNQNNLYIYTHHL
ncbi:ribonuclease 3-like [Fagus crenata]